MGVVFLGDHDCVRYGHLRIWAERGLLHTEDDRDGAYDTISVRTGLQRMLALQEMLGNSREEAKHNPGFNHQLYDRIQKMLEQMVEVCRKAQIQGMPDDPTARADLKRRLPVSVVVPGRNSGL